MAQYKTNPFNSEESCSKETTLLAICKLKRVSDRMWENFSVDKSEISFLSKRISASFKFGSMFKCVERLSNPLELEIPLFCA